MARLYKCKPSELLQVEEEYDSYTAYCFDQACALFHKFLEDKKVPIFEEDRKVNKGLSTLMSGDIM